MAGVRRAAADRGETLLELVVALSIMGVAVVAIVGAIGTSIMVSDIHRKQATAGSTVRGYAEAITARLAAGGYVPCAGEAAYAAPPGFAAPSGYTASVVPLSMRYFSAGTWQSSCTTDSGVQRLTVQVASVDGRASERLVVIVRKPCRLSDPICG